MVRFGFATVLLALCLACCTVSLARDPALPKDVKPIKITAYGEFNSPGSMIDRKYEVYFWNVGAMLDAEHAKVFLVEKAFVRATGEPHSVRKTTFQFEGGPRGKFFREPEKDYNDMVSHIDHAGVSGSMNGSSGVIVFDFWYTGKRLNGWHVPLTITPPDAWDGFPDVEREITATLIRGTASHLKADGSEWVPLEFDAKTPINVNDRIKTGPNTRVEIAYFDGSLFRLKSDTTLTLLTGGLQLQVGEAFFNLQKQGKAFSVVTPTIVCGVLGTTFSLSVDPAGGTTTRLYNGTVQVKHSRTGAQVVLKAGEGVQSGANGLSPVGKLAADETVEAWERSWNASPKQAPPAGQSYTLSGPAAGSQRNEAYPTGDFDLEFELNYQKPGTVFDTMGLNAAPVGAWSVAVRDDEHLTFNLWNGRSWQALVSDAVLKAGRAHAVRLRRTGPNVSLLVDGRPDATAVLPTPLSGKPVYVGDFKGDESWGANYRIHQGMTGSVLLSYFGVPRR